MNFDHLIMGFPLAKGWGVGVGVYSCKATGIIKFLNWFLQIIHIGDYEADHTGFRWISSHFFLDRG